LVSLSFPEDQATIIAKLVKASVIPNSLYNEQMTEAARQQARANIGHTLIYDRWTIIQGGQVIMVTDMKPATVRLAQPKITGGCGRSLGLTFITAAVLFLFPKSSFVQATWGCSPSW
jgi:membrane-associated HD superfamily phosphohydrolase